MGPNIMSLCQECVKFAKRISLGANSKFNPNTSKQSFDHKLSSSVATCQLCALFRYAISQSHGSIIGEQPSVRLAPLWQAYDELSLKFKDLHDPCQAYCLDGLRLQAEILPVHSKEEIVKSRLTSIDFQVFCLNNSLAAELSSFSTRYRFSHTGSDDALSLLRKWYVTCRSNHQQCKCNDHDGQPESLLPARVIDVGSGDEACEPRLRVTDGMRGSWVALSHCWGNEFVRPLRTTTRNIDSHMNMIPMAGLPKTFHDAVIVTRALGVRHLWIDSLCIVQDDATDKREQLPKMGEIYQGAILTILAVEAINCSEGLFNDARSLSYSLLKSVRKSEKWTYLENEVLYETQETRGTLRLANKDVSALRDGIPSVLQRVELPLYHSDEVVGSFFISITEEFQQLPRQTPLFSRAWVMQEQVLSRRAVLFLKDSIVWSCQKGSENERGEVLSFKMPQLDDWRLFVYNYTMRDLTYKEDRLNAIRGLAGVQQLKRKDTYFAGLWYDDLPNDLLWRVRGPKEISYALPYIPSWSWGRHSGPIGFQLWGRAFLPMASGETLSDVVEIVGLTRSGELQLRACIVAVDEVRDFRYHPNHVSKSFLKTWFHGYSSARQVAPVSQSYMGALEARNLDREGLSVVYDRNCAIGWADWDLASTPEGPLRWIPLKLEQGCIWPRRFDPVVDAFHVLYVRQLPGSLSNGRLERVGMGVIIKSVDIRDLLRLDVVLV